MLCCKNCGKEITGKSKNFCSKTCKNQFYYKENKDRILEKNRNWAKENKVKRAEYKRERYHTDEDFRQKILEARRKYYKKMNLEEKGK